MVARPRTPNDQEPAHVRALLGIRARHHWSQLTLARSLGVSLRTIKRWEHGDQDPHPGRMAFIYQLLTATD